MKKALLLISATLLMAGYTVAQGNKKSKYLTYEQMTERMVLNLQLNEKQQKKIEKLNKKYKTLIEGEMPMHPEGGGAPQMGGQPGAQGEMPQGNMSGGRPDGHMGGGRPGGNMGGGMPGGGMGGGRPGGNMSGGMPGGGMPGGGMPGGGMGGPNGHQATSTYNYDQNQKKYDKAIGKILDDGQYEDYLKLKPQFASQRRVMEFLQGGQPELARQRSDRRQQMKTGSVSNDGIGLTSGQQTSRQQTYNSVTADENTVQVTGGTLVLDNCQINKNGGDSSQGDATSFYGINAAIVAVDEGTVNMTGGNIATSATGANGVVAYGGTVNISDTHIDCEKNLSRGIHATGGGTINARNLTVVTCGNNSSVIATDRGGGTVNVEGGTYKTCGKDCAVCYSTGNITVRHIEGESEQGEIAVIEGDNRVDIIDCHMESGDSRRGMMILQSGSGDAEGYNGKISVKNSHLTLTSEEAPLIEITTSTKGTLTLKDTQIDLPSGILMRVDYNKRWKTTSPVATLNLQTDSQATYDGDIEVDSYGTSTVVVDKNVTWNGAYDQAGTGKQTTVVVEGVWNLTADSHVDSVIVKEGGVINRNGYRLESN